MGHTIDADLASALVRQLARETTSQRAAHSLRGVLVRDLVRRGRGDQGTTINPTNPRTKNKTTKKNKKQDRRSRTKSKKQEARSKSQAISQTQWDHHPGRGSRVTAQMVVIATGISADGRREILGFDVGDSESGAFWTAFLRSLKAHGLDGVQLVSSDAHTGLKEAIASTLIGAAWQRCRVHLGRNLVASVPKGHGDMVAAAVRTIFAQPTAGSVRHQLHVIAEMLGKKFPKVEAMLLDNADDLTAFAAFPVEHWRKIWSTNGLERVNREIKRRIDVVGVFPNPPALLRLTGAVLAEIHDEWQVGDRRYLSEASMAKLYEPTRPTSHPSTT
jgi:hypothetical protein